MKKFRAFLLGLVLAASAVHPQITGGGPAGSPPTPEGEQPTAVEGTGPEFFDPTLTLYYDFAGTRSLAAVIGPTLGIVRATEGRYWDDGGILTAAAAGEARFDHNPVTGESLGLLVEETRTNISLQSEDFGTTWVPGGKTDVTVDQVVAPDGLTTADRIHDDGVSASPGGVNAVQSLTIATGSTFAYSVFLKADGLDWAQVSVVALGVLDISAFFDLTDCTIGATTGADNTSEFIESVGDGWCLGGIVFDSDVADSSGALGVVVAEADNDILVDIDGTSSIFAWGADLQEGAFSTSYTPTLTIPVARDADLISTTDVSWYDPLGGTFYSRVSILDDAAHTRIIWQLDDAGSTTERTFVYQDVTNDGRLTILEGGTQAALSTANAYSGGVFVNHAVGFVLDDVDSFTDGTRAGVGDSNANMTADIDNFRLGYRPTDSDVHNGHFDSLWYYRVRKPNEFLQPLSRGEIRP